MFITGESIAALANAVRSLNDARLSDASPLYAMNPDGQFVPLIASDDEQVDYTMTVGDLRELLAPFAAWS